MSSAFIVLNHDHESVDFVLVVKVDSHVTLDFKRIGEHFAVMDTSFNLVKVLLSLNLLVLKIVHLISVSLNRVNELIELSTV